LKSAAFLWDESFLWGVMACKALRAAGLPFELVRAGDIRNGALADYRTLFVPGGWASNKAKALEKEGIDAIRRFVDRGGNYVGFCGGAGLATMDGIGLVPVKRRPTKERVPSFSGRIKLKVNNHPLWAGVSAGGAENIERRTPNSEFVFHAWWPSQFMVDGSVSVLATYGGAMPDSFSSDVNVGDAETVGGWPELERLYQINLDPKRLIGEPAVIEGTFGKGKVLLSLIHFDTPGDAQGAIILNNLWKHLAPNADRRLRLPEDASSGQCGPQYEKTRDAGLIRGLDEAVSGIVEFGQRNFLWFWRNPMLLQWRRGVRGLEYCTLYVMVKELAEILRRQRTDDGPQATNEKLKRTGELLLPFVDKAKQLLIRERFAMQNAHITYERCDDPEIQALREELFSHSKSHGGLFKEVIDEVDRLLYSAMTLR